MKQDKGKRTVEPYQGWNNAQTWCVALYLNNDSQLQQRALDACDGFGSDPDMFGAPLLRAIVDPLQNDAVKMADWAWPNGYNSMEVDWIELAKHFNQKQREIKNARGDS